MPRNGVATSRTTAGQDTDTGCGLAAGPCPAAIAREHEILGYRSLLMYWRRLRQKAATPPSALDHVRVSHRYSYTFLPAVSNSTVCAASKRRRVHLSDIRRQASI